MDDLNTFWNEARAVLASGNDAAFLERLERIDRLCIRIRRDELEFRTQWEALARISFETLNFEEGLEDVRRARLSGFVDEGAIAAWSEAEKFTREASTAISAGRSLLRSLKGQRESAGRYDFAISGWMRCFNPVDKTRLDARLIWLRPVLQAHSLAKRLNLSTILVPDYLNILKIPRFAKHVLSWHTEGRSPGVVHFKPADLPGYVVIDAGGYSGWSSLAQAALDGLELPELHVAEEFRQMHLQSIVSGNTSKYDQRPLENSGNSLRRPFVFVAMQTAMDRTQQLARISMLDMLDIVTSRFAGSGILVVVKRHPKCADAVVEERLQILMKQGLICLRDDSIHLLIPESEAVITVNSGVGSEAIMYMKPIYTFGEADYEAVTHRVSSRAQFFELTSPIRLPVTQALMTRFLYYYRTNYLVDTLNQDRLDRVLMERIFQARLQ